MPWIHLELANNQCAIPSGVQVIVKKLKSFLAPSNFTLCSSSTGFLSFSSFTCSWQQGIRCPGVNSLTCCFVICMHGWNKNTRTCMLTKDMFDLMNDDQCTKASCYWGSLQPMKNSFQQGGTHAGCFSWSKSSSFIYFLLLCISMSSFPG